MGEWVDVLKRHRDAGFTYVDFYTAVDFGDRIRLVVRLADPKSAEYLTEEQDLDAADPRIESATEIFPGADWREREITEMFGVTFVGLVDDRPLLTRPEMPRHPLRKATPLSARLDTPWPGLDPNKRRRDVPGVPKEWMSP